MQLFHMQTAIFLSLLGLGVMERKVLTTPLKSTEFKTLSKLITTVLSFGTQLLFRSYIQILYASTYGCTRKNLTASYMYFNQYQVIHEKNK